MNTTQFVTLELPLTISLEAPDLKPFEFDGYASTFGTVNSYGFGIDSGAFAKTLRRGPYRSSFVRSSARRPWRSLSALEPTWPSPCAPASS